MSLTVENNHFNGLFQNIYLKKKTYFAENKVVVHMFEVPVFAASLTGRMSFLLLHVSDYDILIKQNSHSL